MRGLHYRRRSAPLLAAVALWAGLAADAAAQGNAAADRAALEALYDATGGPGWTDSTNWNTSAPIGEWFGVTTDAAGRVTWLELPGNGLTGPIPAALGDLALLRILTLRSRWDSTSQQSVKNALTGSIPPALGRLANLWGLYLDENDLTGPIPAELGNLVNLGYLGLLGNDLTGPIPAELGNLVNLGVLDLRFNDLTGPIPAELGSLVNLGALSLSKNDLTGPIPAELGSLVNLETLDLSSNALTGSIPAELGSLVNLEWLRLSSNALTGSIPAELGSLVNLEWLRLSSNALTGSIPAELGNLVNLETLDLSTNALTGSIPAELGNLVNLDGLYLGENELTGPIPAELGNLENLENLQLWGNALTGPVPAWLGNLTGLRSLDLGGNDLTGPIPSELGNLENLEHLQLYSNALTGSLPQSLTRLSQLRRLDIRNTGVCAPTDTEFLAWLETIEFIGDTCNRPPETGGTIPPQALAELGPAVGVSTAPYFFDPDGDWLTYAAASSNAGVVTAFVSGDTVFASGDIVWLMPRAAGTARVTVTAQDPDGLSATQVMTVTTAASAGPQSDREVLEVFYDSTSGASWRDSTNWKTSAPLGEWHGVTTDPAGRVTGLELYFDLNGLIPPALGSLVNLRVLILGANYRLMGPIPGELGNLVNLRELTFYANELTGPIPAELGNLVNLRELTFYANELTGPIPAELGNLVNLRELNLWNNKLTGPLPAALGNLVNLRLLDLSRNDFTGPIPAALGSLVNLVELDLRFNDLTGPIPAELGRLKSLGRLDLSYNWRLSGPLPSGIPNLGLNIFVTQMCAPAAWQERLTSEFYGLLCEAEAETDVTIDVAVVYTPAAREAAGGAAAIEAEIDLMIAETNQAYATSGVHQRLALVGRSEVPYTETSSLVDIDRLISSTDGHMDEAHALRARTGADLVHLIAGGPNYVVAGRGQLVGAFGVTHRLGGGLVFAHELGHNMGLVHDRYEAHHGRAGGNAGGVSPHPAYGYVNQQAFVAGAAESSRWSTIMSYPTQCVDAGINCQWLPLFSNPRQSYNGDPLGIPYGAGASGVTGPADAAAVLNAMGPAVAWSRDRPAGANRPPAASGTLPDRALILPGMLTVDVSPAFVDPDGDPLSYTVSSSAPDVVTVLAAGPRVTLTAVGGGRATIRVTATDPGGLSATQAFTVTVAMRSPFTDDPLVAGVTPVRAVHFTELRTRIDALRSAAALGRFVWTDPVLRAGVTPVRLVHLLELREALGAAYAAAGRAEPRWTDAAPVAGSTPIRAVHLMELRAAVVALE